MGSLISFCKLRLFLFSPVERTPPNVLLLPGDFTEALSGLAGGLASIFRELDVNTFRNFAPGDIPRRFLERTASGTPRGSSLCCKLVAAAFRGARSIASEPLLFEMGSFAGFVVKDCRVERLFGRGELGGSTA